MTNNYFIEITNEKQFDLNNIVNQVYKLACRTDFAQPGFALLKLAPDETSAGQRRKMVDIKEQLSKIHHYKRDSQLEWFNMTRFDQKNTTKAHRDGAPNESLLILGYEPTKVSSKLSMADYSKCAYELGITPDQFLEDYNPMYEQGLEKLAPYTTVLSEFDRTSFQILFINNSSNPFTDTQFTEAQSKWQGVLHSAVVEKIDATRVINSTCIAPSDAGDFEVIDAAKVAEFLNSDVVAGSYA